MKLVSCADGKPSNGGTDETEIGGGAQMRGLWVLAIVSMVFLLQACAGNGDDGEPSPATVTQTPQQATVTPTVQPATVTPTLQIESSEIVTIVQEYQVVKKVERDDGLWQTILVPLASRVDEYCSDSPQWSTNEEPTNWRVFAECTKEQSVPGDNPLRFEWLFHPDTQSVQPFNHPAHVAQYQYPWEQDPEYQFEPWY